jgi:hypothetical protein
MLKKYLGYKYKYKGPYRIRLIFDGFGPRADLAEIFRDYTTSAQNTI